MAAQATTKHILCQWRAPRASCLPLSTAVSNSRKAHHLCVPPTQPCQEGTSPPTAADIPSANPVPAIHLSRAAVLTPLGERLVQCCAPRLARISGHSQQGRRGAHAHCGGASCGAHFGCQHHAVEPWPMQRPRGVQRRPCCRSKHSCRRASRFTVVHKERQGGQRCALPPSRFFGTRPPPPMLLFPPKNRLRERGEGPFCLALAHHTVPGQKPASQEEGAALRTRFCPDGCAVVHTAGRG